MKFSHHRIHGAGHRPHGHGTTHAHVAHAHVAHAHQVGHQAAGSTADAFISHAINTVSQVMANPTGHPVALIIAGLLGVVVLAYVVAPAVGTAAGYVVFGSGRSLNSSSGPGGSVEDSAYIFAALVIIFGVMFGLHWEMGQVISRAFGSLPF